MHSSGVGEVRARCDACNFHVTGGVAESLPSRYARVTFAARGPAMLAALNRDAASLARSPWLRAALGAFGIGVMVFAFRGTSFDRAFARIDASAALLAVPALQGVGFCLEALGWRAILATLGERASFRALWRVRVISEALSQSLPLGVLLSEGSKPLLLRSHTGISIPTGTASVAARKYSLVATQALLLALVAVVGGGRLAPIIFGGALVLGISAALSGRALCRGAVADKARRLLARLPFCGGIARRHQAAFTDADVAAERYFGRPIGERASRALPFLMAWCVEALETWFLLRLVGVEVGLGVAFCIEVPLGLLRSVAFFTPAGLGIQDFGYAAALASFGVPDAGAAALAFVVLKRTKEMVWVAVGYALLMIGGSGVDCMMQVRKGVALRLP